MFAVLGPILIASTAAACTPADFEVSSGNYAAWELPVYAERTGAELDKAGAALITWRDSACALLDGGGFHLDDDTRDAIEADCAKEEHLPPGDEAAYLAAVAARIAERRPSRVSLAWVERVDGQLEHVVLVATRDRLLRARYGALARTDDHVRYTCTASPWPLEPGDNRTSMTLDPDDLPQGVAFWISENIGDGAPYTAHWYGTTLLVWDEPTDARHRHRVDVPACPGLPAALDGLVAATGKSATWIAESRTHDKGVGWAGGLSYRLKAKAAAATDWLYLETMQPGTTPWVAAAKQVRRVAEACIIAASDAPAR